MKAEAFQRSKDRNLWKEIRVLESMIVFYTHTRNAPDALFDENS